MRAEEHQRWNRSRYRGRVIAERGVNVAQSAEMELFGRAGLRIELAEEEHEVRVEFGLLLMGGGLARADFIEDNGGAEFGAEIGVTVEQAVIGEAATRLMEKNRDDWRRASRKLESLPMCTLAEAASRSTQGLKTAGRWTFRAWSGRKVG